MQVIYNKNEQKVPVKLWLDDIEDGALKQAIDLSKLPFVFKHIAIMPDCLSDDTEILTTEGFKLIKDLKYSDEVANYDTSNKKVYFKTPKHIINRPLRKNEKVFEFILAQKNKSIIVTENHRVLYKGSDYLPWEIPNLTELKDYTWGAEGHVNDLNELNIQDELLCLIAWCVGDGNVKKNNLKPDGSFSSCTIRFGLTKERKIKRIIVLLDALNIKYTISEDYRQTTICLNSKISTNIVNKYIGVNKSYPMFFIEALSNRQAILFLEECIEVDGDWTNHLNFNSIRYNAKRQEDIDFLSALISIHYGMSNDNTRYTDGFKKIKMHYLSATKNMNLKESPSGLQKQNVIKKEIQYEGNVVCIICDSGFFVARRQGLTFITGNSHQGYGMPIGGVMATKGAVISNAVGVDISCFSGDTKVPLLNGTQKTLKELTDEGKDVYVYSLDKNLELTVGKGTPKLTRKNTCLMEVTISGGETIKCTPDHKFMLLDGSYKEAKDLEQFDSLMPLYRSYETKDGYEHIKTKYGSSVITHKMVANLFLGNSKHNKITHHIDNNWYNNSPDNLEYMDYKLHSSNHRKNKPIFNTEEFKTKRIETLELNGFYDEKFEEKKKRIARDNIKEYNNSDRKKELDKLAGQRGKKYLIKYNKSKKGRAKSSETGKKYGFGKKSVNHKVLFTKTLNKKEDVYCLTVENHHNFAISAGVFVHNCGVTAIQTDINEFSLDWLKGIMGKVRETIPVGFSHNKKEQKWEGFDEAPDIKIIQQELSSARKQLGTLGGGNHFIEFQLDEEGFMWLMIHSGSRNLGYKVAKYYHKRAKELCQKWYSNIPNMDLAFLPLDTPEAKEYLEAMNFCLDFAYASRELMLSKTIDIIGENHFPKKEINIHHNFARMEHHFGSNVMVHRKGATSAYKGQLGIIPGSMGTKSYIVEGLGNPESFMSCSHGAGRKMSRTKAKKTLDLKTEQDKMEGIIGAPRNASELDESPGSYKDIDVVMENQKDLVKIKNVLKPIAVIKG